MLSRQKGPEVDRPDGPLVWIHAAAASDLDAARALTTGLAGALEGDAAVLLTATEMPAPLAEAARRAVFTASQGEARRFLDAWRPEAAVLIGNGWEAILPDLARRGLPVILAHAAPPARSHRRIRTSPGAILTRSEADARDFRRLGAERVEVTGPLSDCASPPPFDPETRDRIAGGFAGRPAWLALSAAPAEQTAVLNAHRRATGASHRLMLILAPSDPAEGPALAGRLSGDWRVARRGAGEDPAPDVEILIADRPEEIGLWLRLAPVSYLGGTLMPDLGPVPDPFAAAALGSAVLHGPHTGAMSDRFDRLGQGNAAALVLTEAALGNGVVALLSPDRAAARAHAGWRVTSAGAEATDRAVALTIEALERAGAI